MRGKNQEAIKVRLLFAITPLIVASRGGLGPAVLLAPDHSALFFAVGSSTVCIICKGAPSPSGKDTEVQMCP